jgi:hypothetical protein
MIINIKLNSGDVRFDLNTALNVIAKELLDGQFK